MKCFVHVGFDPFPKEANDPSEAISLAEKYLSGKTNKEFSIYWRRDDLYPKNLVCYSKNELLEEIQREGDVTLQVAKVRPSGLPILGEVVTIVSSEEEERNAREADKALYR